MSDVTTEPPIEPAGSVLVREAKQRPRGDLRRRLLRHFLPIAVASALALVVFMNLSFFDANRYPPPMEIMVEGFSGAIGEQGGTPVGAGMHAGGQPGVPASDPSAGQPDMGSMDHGGGRPAADPAVPSDSQNGTAAMEHTGDPAHDGPTGTGPMEHGAGAATVDQIETAPTQQVPDSASETETAPMEHGGPTSGGQSGTTPPGPAGGQAGMPLADPGGGPGDTELLMRKYSTATGYVALGLLGLTLLVGPANLVRRRRTPLSSYLCRDVGIAAATLSAAHVIFGFLTQHSEGIVAYFFEADDRSRILTTSFGLANWTGLAAVVIVAALAAISSDWALRKLKAKRWKRIQRLNYILFPLVVAHSVLYGALLRLTSPYTALLGVSVVAVLVGQAVGIGLWRRGKTRKTGDVTATA